MSDEEYERPSKSARKRESTDLQELGEELIALPQSEFDALELPDTLRDAVLLARRITKHGGLYRQKQYIGKLMRKIDAEPIRAALDGRHEQNRVATLLFRRLEQWRDQLLASEPGALERLLREHPDVDRKHLQRLIDRARHESETNAPPAAARELFRFLRETVSG
jgi:ribosome-associated protein